MPSREGGKAEENPQDKILRRGDLVRVFRTSGKIEDDWKIIGWAEDDVAIVQKEIGGGKVLKKIFLELSFT